MRGGFSQNMSKIGKRVRAVLAAMFVTVFIVGAFMAIRTYNSYKADRAVYDGVADVYVFKPDPETRGDVSPGASDGDTVQGPDDGFVPDGPPITVDFEALQAVAPDVQGWLYCEGTAINYPVVQGGDNDQYLRHDYIGNYAMAGSIFVEAANSPGFVDSNTVIYGHHMKDGSMFAGLQDWAEQAYYDSHKNMWLLTPDGDYRVELFAGYITPAGSDTYAVFQGPSEYFDEYLAGIPEKSDFEADPDITLDRDARYVVLSTCDYTYADARYVLHGKLVPVGP